MNINRNHVPRLRFGLRFLVVFVAALAVLLSFLASYVNKARRKSHIVESIRSSGGIVETDEAAQYPGSTALRDMLGSPTVDGVVAVGLSASLSGDFDPSQDFDLSQLTEFQSLRYLDLSLTQITDQDLATLNNLGELEELLLSWTNITGVGFAECKFLGRLKTLNLAACRRFGDEGASRILPKLTSVEELDLTATDVSDESLATLSSCKQLKRLHLSQTRAGAIAVTAIARLERLEYVSVGNTRITMQDVFWLEKRRPSLKISLR